MTNLDDLQQGYEAQSKAAELFQAKSDEQAHLLNRFALEKILIAFHRGFEGRVVARLLLAFRSLAVTAFVTGRSEEGLAALGTGLAYADVGLRHWPGAAPLLDEQAQLASLAEKVSGQPTAYVIEEVTDDWRWPFEG